MRQNTNKLIVALILMVCSIIACTKDLDVTDQNNPTTESYFKTASQLQNGVNAIYVTGARIMITQCYPDSGNRSACLRRSDCAGECAVKVRGRNAGWELEGSDTSGPIEGPVRL